MSQRLQHARLEQAIYQKQTLGGLLGLRQGIVTHYCVVDYVGNPAVKPAGGGAADQQAEHFFADQGAFRETLLFKAVQYDQVAEDFNVAIFATFLVLEIHPGSAQAEFLVLAPQRSTEQVGQMYTGLMPDQNTDQLRTALKESGVRGQLAGELAALLTLMRTPVVPYSSANTSWFGRLFRQEK